jgi:hypothetical protein
MSGFAVLVGLGHRLLGRILLTDYGSLYASYELGFAHILNWFGSGYGWLIVAVAVAGYVAGQRWPERRQQLTFVGVYGLVLLGIWAVVVGQEDVHYAAHFVAPVAVGLAAFAWFAWTRTRAAGGARLTVPAMAVFGGLLVVNLLAGLSPLLPNDGSIARSLLAVQYAPLVRSDYDVMTSLAADLRRVAGTDRPILVNGSTDFFSDDTVVIADDVSRGDRAPLFVLTAPHVDSRDTYPLAVLVGADVVVVPDPLPLPLPPDKQGVQRVVHDLFASPSSFAAAFEQRPETYRLADGTNIRIFERTRPTTVDEAVAALQQMESYTPQVPGEQFPWVSVGGLEMPLADASADPASIIDVGRGADGDWTSNALIYVGADDETSIAGSAEFLDRICGGVAVTVASIDGTLASGATRRFELTPDGARTFTVEGLGTDARDLLIQSEPLDPSRPCSARITLDAAAGDTATARDLLKEDAGSGNP